MKYDLEERVEKFGEGIILFCKNIPKDLDNDIIKKQLIRSGTSVGANYLEANNCISKKDFKHKIGIARREANETKHWLRMISKSEPKLKISSRELWSEAHELTRILSSILLK
jgi:four helix bundle protein